MHPGAEGERMLLARVRSHFAGVVATAPPTEHTLHRQDDEQLTTVDFAARSPSSMSSIPQCYSTAGHRGRVQCAQVPFREVMWSP
jgi:hypothetical protein